MLNPIRKKNWKLEKTFFINISLKSKFARYATQMIIKSRFLKIFNYKYFSTMPPKQAKRAKNAASDAKVNLSTYNILMQFLISHDRKRKRMKPPKKEKLNCNRNQ